MSAPKHGIPTMYDGVQFRSRLEAKWAYVFTAFEWRWTYEPFDADGYIPDFILHLDTPCVVEVKPVTTLSEYTATLDDAITRLGDHWKHDVLVVGVAPYYVTPKHNWSLGMAHNSHPFEVRRPDAVWPEVITGTKVITLNANNTGLTGGTISAAHMDDGWKQAGNATQWKPKPRPDRATKTTVTIVDTRIELFMPYERERDHLTGEEVTPDSDPGSWCAVTFAYSPAMLDMLKETVPHYAREWSPENKTWYVSPYWVDDLSRAIEASGAFVRMTR